MIYHLKQCSLISSLFETVCPKPLKYIHKHPIRKMIVSVREGGHPQKRACQIFRAFKGIDSKECVSSIVIFDKFPKLALCLIEHEAEIKRVDGKIYKTDIKDSTSIRDAKSDHPTICGYKSVDERGIKVNIVAITGQQKCLPTSTVTCLGNVALERMLALDKALIPRLGEGIVAGTACV